MKRTDALNNNGGQFQDGNTQTGVKGTKLDETWLNNVQEELCSVIENEGGTLDEGNQQQVWETIRNMVTPRGYLSGFELANGSGDSEHDIDIAAGSAKGEDSTGVIANDSAITKQIDAPWSAGTDAGGFPSALTLAADTWYRVFVIGKADGTMDAGFDTSATAANLMADAIGFDYYRRVGWVRTDSSMNLRPFRQYGDSFRPLDNVETREESTDTSTTHSGITVDSAAPPDTVASVYAALHGLGKQVYGLVDEIGASRTPSGTLFHFVSRQDGGGDDSMGSGVYSVLVDASSQFRFVTGGDSGPIIIALSTNAWTDTRGK